MKKALARVLLVTMSLYNSVHAVAKNSPSINGGSVTSIFFPEAKGDSALMEPISIFNEQIKVDIFEGYAVVDAKYWFNNSSQKRIDMRVGIPQEENKFSAVYWLRISVDNRPFLITTDTFPDHHWQFWDVSFSPGVTGVELFYGVKTSEASLQGEQKAIHGNCFQYDFSEGGWKGNPGKSEIWFRMNGGYVTQDVLGLLPDGKFMGGNSILHAWRKDILSDSSRQVLLWYRSLDSISFNPGRVSWEMKFNNLNQWNPNEKTLATLQPFSAMDFEGKTLQRQVDAANKIQTWKWISGVAITLFILTVFIVSEIRNRKTQ